MPWGLVIVFFLLLISIGGIGYLYFDRQREQSKHDKQNELRRRQNTALSLHFSINDVQLPAAAAIRGYRGIVEGKDYRGVPVWAATRAIPDSP